MSLSVYGSESLLELSHLQRLNTCSPTCYHPLFCKMYSLRFI